MKRTFIPMLTFFILRQISSSADDTINSTVDPTYEPTGISSYTPTDAPSQEMCPEDCSSLPCDQIEATGVCINVNYCEPCMREIINERCTGVCPSEIHMPCEYPNIKWRADFSDDDVQGYLEIDPSWSYEKDFIWKIYGPDRLEDVIMQFHKRQPELDHELCNESQIAEQVLFQHQEDIFSKHHHDNCEWGMNSSYTFNLSTEMPTVPYDRIIHAPINSSELIDTTIVLYHQSEIIACAHLFPMDNCDFYQPCDSHSVLETIMYDVTYNCGTAWLGRGVYRNVTNCYGRGYSENQCKCMMQVKESNVYSESLNLDKCSVTANGFMHSFQDDWRWCQDYLINESNDDHSKLILYSIMITLLTCIGGLVFYISYIKQRKKLKRRTSLEVQRISTYTSDVYIDVHWSYPTHDEPYLPNLDGPETTADDSDNVGGTDIELSSAKVGKYKWLPKIQSNDKFYMDYDGKPTVHDDSNYFDEGHLPSAQEISSYSHTISNAANEKFWIGADEVSIENEIGSGNFGSVYKAKYMTATVAVKKVDAGQYMKEGSLFFEVTDYPNICKFYGLYTHRDAHFLVMEYFKDGSVLNVIQNGNLAADRTFDVFTQIIGGILYLHSKEFVHADIALRNCLIDLRNMHVALTDFGLSCKVGTQESLTTLAPRWASPELSRNRMPTHASDVWAVGITLVELLTCGQKPYRSSTTEDVFRRLQKRDGGVYHPFIEDEWPEEAKQILSEIFVREEQRPKIKEVSITCLKLAPRED